MVHILSQRLAKTDELLLGKVADESRIKTVQTPISKNRRQVDQEEVLYVSEDD